MKKLDYFLKTDFYKISIAISLTGVGAGFFSYLLHESVHVITEYLGTFKKFSLITLIYSISFALLSYVLTKKVFKDTGGSGIPQVKLALVAYKGKMPKRMPLENLSLPCSPCALAYLLEKKDQW